MGWAYEHHDFGDVWARGFVPNRPDGGANPPTKHHGSPVRNVEPLVRLSEAERALAVERVKNPAEILHVGGDMYVPGNDDAHAAALEKERDALLALMRKAHAVMRECGWQLAPGCEPQGDGIIELAAAEVEAEFAAALRNMEDEISD